MVGGRDFFGAGEQAKFNLAMGKGRHTGSSFKPIVLAAALQDGIPLTEQFPAPGRSSCTYDDPPRIWDVGNYGEGGPGVPGRPRRGDGQVVQHGVRPADPARSAPSGPSRWPTPWASPATLDAVAVGRARRQRRADPRDGVGLRHPRQPRACTSTPVLVTSDRAGRRHDRLRGRAPPAAGHVDPDVADKVHGGAASGRDRAGHRHRRPQLDRPVAGKTGTAQEWRNAWFCGYMPQLPTAVWVGFPARRARRWAAADADPGDRRQLPGPDLAAVHGRGPGRLPGAGVRRPADDDDDDRAAGDHDDASRCADDRRAPQPSSRRSSGSAAATPAIVDPAVARATGVRRAPSAGPTAVPPGAVIAAGRPSRRRDRSATGGRR